MQDIFHDFDFEELNSPDFKEDSVRELLILPILNKLGYGKSKEAKIHRSKSVTHSFVQTGSGKHPLKSVPDYLLEVDGKYAWVLDAKGPNEEIKTGDNRQQAFFYAIHPEINVPYYALCNGKEFVLFEVNNDNAILHFSLSEIDKHVSKIEKILSPDKFRKVLSNRKVSTEEKEFDYLSVKPLDEIKTVRKRAAKRHFGVHGYFTKQSWDVVHAYIKNFTKPNDIILDPFGGSGITVIEALMSQRRGIHIDLNPMSVFLVSSIIAPVNHQKLFAAFESIKLAYQKSAPTSESAYDAAIEKYPHPTGNKLPKGSDVPNVEGLFSKRQTAQLAYLKHLIRKVNNRDIRNTLMLVFSTTITKINRTYHHSTYASENAGDCSAFRYYRFRIAPHEVNLDTFKTFEGKFKKIVAAKNEIAPLITAEIVNEAIVKKGSATDLDFVANESIDYIYTDPPYGDKIPYLDLSVMWNAWLDLEVTEEDYKLEAIEGGEAKKSKKDYSDLIADSIREMFRVLKFDRWMSFVFQHQDPAYWHLIVETAQKAGFEFVNTVKQNNGQSSFKKRQNPFTVLSGQLIINFRKVRNPKTIMKADIGGDITDLITQTIEGIIAKNAGATIEEINNELITRGLVLGFLDVLSKKYADISPFLLANFDFHEDTETFHIRKNTKFRSQLPVELRIKYYLVSMMRRLAHQNEFPSFDDIILDLMPLLQNGITPDNQTILSVLETVAERDTGDRWKLKEFGQGELFETM